ncbi:MAG: hypothetical protein ACK4ZJ_20190, partial [Allorhizobium sp.]
HRQRADMQPASRSPAGARHGKRARVRRRRRVAAGSELDSEADAAPLSPVRRLPRGGQRSGAYAQQQQQQQQQQAQREARAGGARARGQRRAAGEFNGLADAHQVADEVAEEEEAEEATATAAEAAVDAAVLPPAQTRALWLIEQRRLHARQNSRAGGRAGGEEVVLEE